MKERSTMTRKQLPLLRLAPSDPVLTLPSSDERPLMVALGELLLLVAADEARAKGGSDERQDP